MSFTTLSTTQKAFVEAHLRGTGRRMSAQQAKETYGIKNLRAVMSTMRAAGLRVKRSVNTSGRTAYSISRRDLAGTQGSIFQ